MGQEYDIKGMTEKIRAIKEAATELKHISGGVQVHQFLYGALLRLAFCARFNQPYLRETSTSLHAFLP